MSWNEKQKPQRLVRYAVMLLMLLTLGVGQMWADTYCNAASVKYNDGSDHWWDVNGTTKALGTVTTFKLKGFWLQLKDGNVCQNSKMYYKVTGGVNSSATIKDPNDWSASTKHFQTESLDVNVLSGLSCGNHTLNIWFEGHGQSDCKSLWYSNDSKNYKMSFTIPGFTTTSTSHTFSNTTVGSNRSQTISFTNHYGTALTTSNCALSGDDASEFSVTSISETGVTVRFAPTTAGSKSATLTITDAHSKTCTITLSGKTQYTVSYNKGSNGTGSNTTANKVYGTSLTLLGETFTRTGYTQTAWNTDASGTGGTSYALSGSYTSEAAVTLYPTWTAKTTTVTLDKNTPDEETVTGASSVTATYDSALPSFTALECSGGYALTGYWDDDDGGNKIINADGSFNANSGIWNRLDGATLTLYAQWSLDRTLTYDGNTNTSGNVPAAATTYSNGAEVTVLGNVNASPLVKTGYTFTGWNTAANGSGDPYSAGDEITMDANYTLYAQWSENMTTVTVNVSPAGWGTLTVGGASFAAGNTTTAGVTTSRTVVATAANSDFKFNGWTATNCVASPTNNKTTTLSGNGSSATGTLQAAFVEDVASGWYLGGTDFGNSWNVSNTAYPLSKKYRGMDGVFYRQGTVTTSGYDCLHNGTTRYRPSTLNPKFSGAGWANKISLSRTDDYSSNYMFTTAGTYYIIADTRGATPVIWYETSEPERRNYHTVNVTGAENAKGAVKVTLGSTSGFETTKFANGETFYISVTPVSGWIPTITIGDNTPVTWWKEGASYTASGTMSTSDVTVTISYTATRAVTFAETTGCSTLSATGPSSIAVTTGTKVKDGTVITFAQTASTGYTFSKWYSNNTGTSGTQYSTSSSAYDLTISSTSYTIYPLYTENSYLTTVAVSPAGKGSISSPTPVDGKVPINQVTGTAVTASPTTNYVFDHWTISGGSLAHKSPSTSTSNAGTFTATSTGGTITAYFEDQWNLKGSWDSWTDYIGMPLVSGSTYRVTLTLEARRTYDFKVVKRGATRGSGDTFYGSNPSTTFTRGGTTSKTGLYQDGGSDYNFHVTTDAAGDYTFTYVYNAAVGSMQVSVGFPEAYTITFGKGTGGSTITATASASGTLSSGNYVASGEDVTFTQTVQTGYTFADWYDAASGGSAVSGMGVSDPVLENVTGNKTVYSRYTAHTYQLRFNKNDVGASGTMSNQSFTYDEASKAITSNAFYKDGYSFDYWTTNADGTGTQYTNGQSVRNLSSTNNDVIDLYAHWTEVTITDLTFEPASAAGSTTVTVTPVLSGTPTGTSSICWGLYYDALCTREVPIEFSSNPSAGAAAVTFTSPASSGSYYVKATYRTGSVCNAGTVLGEPRIEQYVVASKHDVTVKYMCGSTEIASRRLVEVPAASTTLVAPADIFGYTFSSWSAGEGITITDPTDAELEETGLTGVANVKKLSATYNGFLTANYTKKSMILFQNTLNWNKVYVNVYPNTWWGDKGAGNKTLDATKRNQLMSLVPGTEDIYYFECTPTTAYVSFTDRSQDNYEYFAGSTSNRVKVSYPTKPDASGSESTDYGFNAGTPMFVPLSGQTAQKWNNTGDGDKAEYYNKGYWRKYEPATGKTGYTLEIYNKTPDSSRDTVYTIPMVESTSNGDIFEATVILEANKTGDSKYGVKFRRDNGMRYTMTSGSFAKNGSYSVFTKSPDNYAAYGMETTVAGEYTFRIACANDGTLKMAVKYPASAGDYRLVYTDDVHSLAHPSEIVRKEANGSDIVSFFVREDQSPSIQMQSCSLDGSGNVSWSNYGDAINPASTYESVITEDGVYNFHLAMDEDGALSISKVEPYTGDFYIRTDAVGGTKWADFRNEAHKMKYSDYAAANKGFTHYFVNWVTQNSNVKFTVANDYSPCISDTLVADPIGNVIATIDGGGKMTSANANIRFMYNVKDNSIKRAYIAGAQDNGSHFLVLQGQNGYITDPSGNRLMSANSNNYEVENDATQLADNNEWLYKISVKATPGGKVKLYARYNSVDQYFIGKAAVDDWSTADASEVLISGDGEAQNISVVYDYKTDRMIAAWEPADEINAALTLNADILIVREHQEPATNITFGDAAYSLSTDKTVYGVMRFYRDTLDNRDGNGDLLPVADQLPQRERYHYYISFPFDVNVSDIFGFGSYGVHWVLQYYDGKARAKNGLWADPGMTYWKYVPPTGKLNANEGYLLALSPSKMAYTNTADGQVWAKGKNVVELYFPDATMGATIKDDNVTIPAPSEDDYKCTIWRGEATGEHEGDRNYDRRIADSYWRCIGVPSFKDFDDKLENGTSAFAWVDPAAYSTGDIHFLYEVQWADYSLRAVSGDNYDFKAMHAYMVQNSTAIVWNNVNAISHSSSIVARHRNADEIDNVEFRLELQQNNELVDQTFVRLSDDEAVTAGFEFNHDMSKELYSTKANIYTLIGMEPVAANSLPISTQTTVIPVGLTLASDGEYTFAMPDGTSGVSVTLVDNVSNTRTNLGLTNYTVNLTAGDCTSRFTIEIAPIMQTPTSIDHVQSDEMQGTKVRKVMIDGLLYIIKGDRIYDATGALVK